MWQRVGAGAPFFAEGAPAIRLQTSKLIKLEPLLAMTKRIWTLHSWLGLIAGLGLLVIGLTGSALVFRQEIDGLVAAKIMRVTPTPEGRLSWDQVLAVAQKSWPEFDVTGFGPRDDPRLADLVYVKKRGTTEYRGGTIDQFAGKALCSPMTANDTLTGVLLELHYTWFANHVGMLITGLFAVMLCLLGLSGLWLYRGFWRNFFTLRWGRSARIFFSDLHKMLGISSVVFNLILGFTGAYWNLTHIAAEGLSEPKETELQPVGPQFSSDISLQALTLTAKTSLPGFETQWISFPGKPGEPITLWGKVRTRNPLIGDYSSTVAFDAQSGELKQASDIHKAGLWEKITSSFRPLHYGTFGGLPIKILWSMGGLMPGALAISGFLILRSRRKLRS